MSSAARGRSNGILMAGRCWKADKSLMWKISRRIGTKAGGCSDSERMLDGRLLLFVNVT